MKVRLVILILSIAASSLPAQTWTWDSIISAEPRVRLVKNHKDQVYVFGKYSNVLTKYSSSGILLWRKTFSGGVHLQNIACGSDHMVYITGRYSGSLFSGAEGVSDGGEDIFVSKLDNNGAVVWTKKISSHGIDGVGDLCLEGTNKLLVTGHTCGTTNFSGTVISKAENRDLFIARYDVDGHFENAVFATLLDSIGGSRADEIETDGDGNIYLLAGIAGKVELGSVIFDESTSMYAPYFLKFDPSFNLIWSKRAENAYHMITYDLRVNSQNELIYCVYNGAHYSYEGFLKKLSADGATVTILLEEVFGRVNGIDLDAADNIYFAGYHSYVYSWGGTPPTKYYLHYGKMRPDGSKEWEINDSAQSRRIGLDIKATNKGAFAAGMFRDSVSLFNDIIDLDVEHYFLAALNTGGIIDIGDPKASVMPADQSIFPNPSTGIFTLRTKGSNSGKICIYDVLGHCVFSSSITGNSEQVDLSDAGKGIYFVEVETADQRIIKKIVLN